MYCKYGAISVNLQYFVNLKLLIGNTDVIILMYRLVWEKIFLVMMNVAWLVVAQIHFPQVDWWSPLDEWASTSMPLVG